jgi:hypothetical protein
MATPRRATKKRTPAKKRATKKTTKRAAPKKNGAAKRKTKKPKGDSGPLELVVKDEAMKFQLEAADLLFSREDQRLLAELQPKVDDLVNRTKRNDQKWKKAQKRRVATINELIKTHTEQLPPGYAIKRVSCEDGTYTATYDPEARGQLLK